MTRTFAFSAAAILAIGIVLAGCTQAPAPPRAPAKAAVAKVADHGHSRDSLGIIREFAGTISGEVDGTPFAGDLAEQPHGDHDHR